MRVINISLSELETKMLMIGFEGENQITQVRIDAAEILTDYPNATPTLIVKPLFGFAYPVIVTQEGTDVVWEIDNSVLSFHGDGEIQLTFTEGTVIAKSYVGRIRIKRSLEVNGEAPDPIETWEQAATAKLAEVDAQISELEGMVDAAEAAKDQAQDIVDDAAADIQAAGATQIAAVEAKGEEVKESIPADYSTLSGDVSGLKSALTKKAKSTDTDATDVDLDVTDESGNVLVRLADGHIKTKNFDSSALPAMLAQKQNVLTFDSEPTEDSNNPVTSNGVYEALQNAQMDDSKFAKSTDTDATDVDLDFIDRYGNVYVRLSRGHIRTKEFDSEQVVDKIETVGNTRWKGKKWAAVGDSLTEVNLRTTLHYHDYIAEKTGITVVNMGSSGTGYKKTESDNRAFYQRILNVPTDSDVVTIFGSGNDLSYVADALGDITDTTTDTLCGCINKTISNLYSIMPVVQLGIITPTPWINNTPANNGTMARYVEKLIAICERDGIPYLDLFHCSNLRPNDVTFRQLAYSKDDGNGVHPDEVGHLLIAPRVQWFLDSLIMH